MDNRLLAINNVLASYSIGIFDVPEVELSPKLDEIDSILSSVNLLGEELRSTTISRDFFMDMYNSVTDFLIVLDTEGKIVTINPIFSDKLSLKDENIIGKEFSLFNHLFTVPYLRENIISDNRYNVKTHFKSRENKLIHVDCSCSIIRNRSKHEQGFLIVAEDITEKIEKEKIIFKRITESQEHERKRVADDLHDSLGQELSSVKMMLDTIASAYDNDKFKSALNTCTNILDDSISNIRKICFDLIPSALANGDFISAIKQLSERMVEEISLKIESNIETTSLLKEQEIALYRALQEFIHNSLKHAQATIITVSIKQENSILSIVFSDNGVGFDSTRIKPTETEGRGLDTMIKRLELFDGKAKIISKKGKGTSLVIFFNT